MLLIDIRHIQLRLSHGIRLEAIEHFYWALNFTEDSLSESMMGICHITLMTRFFPTTFFISPSLTGLTFIKMYSITFYELYMKKRMKST